MNFQLRVLFVVVSVSAQYGGPQTAQPFYLQQAPPYITAARQGPQVFEGAPPPQQQQQRNYVLPGQPQIQQILLPTAVDRQVQRVAQQVAGREYAQQVQAAQLQGQAQAALDAAQRKATSQTLNRQIQPIPVPQVPAQQPQQPQPQYLREERPVFYTPQVQAYRPAAPARALQPQRQEQDSEDYDSNPNYQFGFDVKDDLYTNYQNRKEQREGDRISGSYSVVDSDGFVRTVKYTADPKEGFKAEVTRQPTNIVVKIPQPVDRQPAPQRYIQAVPVARPRPQEVDEQRQNLIYQYQ